VRRRDIGDPVAQRFVRRVFQGARPGGDRHDLRTHELHAIDVEPLPPDVFLAHVDHTLEPEARADGGGGDAVLAGARFRDDAAFVHPLREQHLAERVVDLVRARVIQVLTLQYDLRPDQRGEPRHGRNRGRPADVVLEQRLQLGPETRVVPRRVVDRRELLERVHQRLGDIAAAVGTEATCLSFRL